MKFEFIVLTGVFFNLMMVGFFPHQLLSTDLANDLIAPGSIGYDFTDQDMFNSKYKSSVTDFYETSSDQEQLQQIYNAEDAVTTSPLETTAGFFDGLLDGLQKAKMFLSFIVPFASLFFLFPGLLGIILGGVYSTIFGIGVIRFIRGI